MSKAPDLVPELLDPIGESAICQDSEGCDADKDEHAKQRRDMSFKEETWFYYVRVGFLLATSVGSLIVVGVYILHLILPISCRWLSDAEIVKLKDLAITIIVGLVMSAATTYFFKKKDK